MEIKKFWTSKLFWLGVIQIAGAGIEFVFNLAPGASIGTLISGILTIIFRFMTNQPVTSVGRKKPAGK